MSGGPGSPGSAGGPGGASGPGSASGRRRREETEYRGIRWRRSVGGTITWRNDGLGQWVTWYAGADAPPLPPGWEPEGVGVAAPGARVDAGRSPGMAGAIGAEPAGAVVTVAGGAAPVERRPMLSGYRLVPVLIALFVVALAVWQATRPPATAGTEDILAAKALKGECLARDGGTAAKPQFSPVTVSCSSKQAAVKVVVVVVPTAKAGARQCPAGAGVVQVLQPGVKDEPWECTEPVRHS